MHCHENKEGSDPITIRSGKGAVGDCAAQSATEIERPRKDEPKVAPLPGDHFSVAFGSLVTGIEDKIHLPRSHEIKLGIRK